MSYSPILEAKLRSVTIFKQVMVDQHILLFSEDRGCWLMRLCQGASLIALHGHWGDKGALLCSTNNGSHGVVYGFDYDTDDFVSKDAIYVHVKTGTLYCVRMLSLNEETGQVMVTYSPVTGETYETWTRPITEFIEKFKLEVDNSCLRSQFRTFYTGDPK